MLTDESTRIARTIDSEYVQNAALTDLAVAVAQAGQRTLAAQITRGISYSHLQVRALAVIATSIAKSGNLAEARSYAGIAERMARAITDLGDRARAYIDLISFLAHIDEHERVLRLAEDALQLATAGFDSSELPSVARDLVGALARSDNRGRAEQIARTTVTEDVTEIYVDLALEDLTTASAEAGDLSGAERIARSIAKPDIRARACSSLITYFTEAGDRRRALILADAAEQSAARSTFREDEAWALADVAAAVAEADESGRALALADHAEHVARTITRQHDRKARTLIKIAAAVARAGEHDHVRQLTDEAERIVPAITDPDVRAELLIALARANDRDRAPELVAAALAVCSWTSITWWGIDDLAPEALTALADCVLESWESAG